MVIVTKEEDAVSNHTINMAEVAPCSHEEANIRIFLYVKHHEHAAEEGSKVIIVKASHTDVLIIAVSVLPTLQEISLQQLAKGRTRDGSQYMTCASPLHWRRPEEVSSSMPSLAAMLSQHSVGEGSRRGKPGM